MVCTYKPWLQGSTISYPPWPKLLDKNSSLSVTKTKTQVRRKSLDNRFDDVEDGDIDDDDDGGSGSLKFALPSHVKSITSTSNPFVKHCLKLKTNSSFRHSHASALVVGTTPISVLSIKDTVFLFHSLVGVLLRIMKLKTSVFGSASTDFLVASELIRNIFREIYRHEEASQEKTVMDCLLLLDTAEIPEGLDTRSVHIVRISSLVLKKLSGVQSAESIEAIALMRFPTSFLNLDFDQNKSDCRRWFPSTHRILVLDGIQDPGNLGTLFRSAMAFQWGGVFLLPGCCDPFNEKALRASRGASFQLPIVSGSWHHLQTLKDTFNMKMLAGHPDSDGKSKKTSSLFQDFVHSLAHVPLCLVLGSEGRGLSEKSQQQCELVSIPMAGEFESLNVSVAGGIFLYMLQPKN